MDDLECMACPPKYRHIATFWKYYSGRAKAPYPTLFSERAGPAFCLLSHAAPMLLLTLLSEPAWCFPLLQSLP